MEFLRRIGGGIKQVADVAGNVLHAIGDGLNTAKEEKSPTPPERASTTLPQRTSTASTVYTPPPPAAPWRRLQDVIHQSFPELIEKIEKCTPASDSEVPKARILMIGQIGAGKSSFVNTINSIFSGGITQLSQCGNAENSFTMVYRQHEIRPKGKREPLKFFLCDTCGIEEKEGPSVEDLKYLLDGNVPDGYKFNHSSPITPNIRGFIKCPELKDRVHCVVFVCDATVMEVMSNEMWNKLKKIQVEVSQRDIPRVILLTRIDKLSKTVRDDVSEAFKSTEVSGAVEKVSQMLGIPQHNVHPIKNYESEMCLNEKISRLALTALEQMLVFANDFVDVQSLALSKVKPWREPTPHMTRENLLALMEKIENYSPPSDLGIPFARILMIGPVGAGKSSFFNSIASTFSGRMTQRGICGSSQTSLTTEYRQHKIKGYKTDKYLNFRLCDTCGIEDNQGPDAAELMLLIEGNVPDGYQFNPAVPLTLDTNSFIKQPRLKDKVHCVVFVLDATSVDLIAQPTWDKLNRLQVQMNRKGLPRAVLLTKIDQVSKSLYDDISKVFHSDEIHKVVDKVSEMLGIPKNTIHPIKNYEREMVLNDKIGNLALLALDQILGFASDFLLNKQDPTDNTFRDMFLALAVLVALVALVITFFKFVVMAAVIIVVVCIIYASVFGNE